jgi:hypothetical protein
MKPAILKISIIASTAATILYFSCSSKKLDLLPHGPTEANYFAQESDFSKAVFGVYAKMTDFFWYNGGNSLAPMLYWKATI